MDETLSHLRTHYRGWVVVAVEVAMSTTRPVVVALGA